MNRNAVFFTYITLKTFLHLLILHRWTIELQHARIKFTFFLLKNKLPRTNLVALGGSTGTVSTSLAVPMAPTDLLYLPRGLGDGGWGRPRQKVALLLAGRTESLRGFTGGGGGWGRDTLGLRFFLLSSIFPCFFLYGCSIDDGIWDVFRLGPLETKHELLKLA